MGFIIQTTLKLITKGTGAPLNDSNITVQLYDEDVYLDDFLGANSPNQDGNVTISFDTDDFKSADSPFEQFPDLYFVVKKDSEIIYKSKVMKDVKLDTYGNVISYFMPAYGDESNILITSVGSDPLNPNDNSTNLHHIWYCTYHRN